MDQRAADSVLLQVARDRQTKSDFHHGISSELIRALHTSFPATEVPTRSWKTQSIYMIEDLVIGKRTTTHIHNLRPSEVAQRGQYLWKSPIIMNRNLWLKQSTATGTTGTSAPLWNSESVGQVLERHAIVGNHIRPFSMLTSCTTISGRMQ